VTADGVIVVWETDVAGNSQVDYGPTTGYGLVASDSTSVTHHALTLTGLSPYTPYHYRVATEDQPLGSDSVFRTAAPATQTTFSFVAFGDTRTTTRPTRAVSSVVSLRRILSAHGRHGGNGQARASGRPFSTSSAT
jgi:phosphodiesterase/alkaline phosphatase D-like protein